ncbi:MAG TPA: hypothetical protein VJZ70_06515 [Limnochordia bacterium]|nr:hypothetical protein [Limnochordia bacterium]
MSNPAQDYFLKLWIRSIDKPFVFPVAEAAWGRFKRSFQAKKDGFFIFATRDGRTMALNLNCVQLAQVWIEAKEEPQDPWDSPGVTFYLSGGKSESFEVRDPVDLAQIFTKLKVGTEEENLSFTGGDEKLIIFDTNELILLEAATDFVEEGYKQIYFRERGTLPPR